MRPSVPSSHFDRLYAASGDPWEYETSAYEDDKYRLSLAALPRERYARGLEVGCSIGVLTARLARRCGALLGLDASAAPLARARERCAGLPHVRLAHQSFPHDASGVRGPFDLLVLSEVGYYMSRPDLEQARDVLARLSASGAHLLLVHWLGSTGGPLTGDEVHGVFLADRRWRPLVHERRASLQPPGFRLDLLERL